MATLIVKATEKCNSNCYYCDVVFKTETGTSMSLPILEQVFIRIDEFLKDKPEENVEILWHGGEPLLLGPEYYKSAVEFQEKHCCQTKHRIQHHIQTNLTCFNESYIDVLKQLGIQYFGTSYDPEPHIRGPGKTIDSDYYNQRFMKALSLIEQTGFGWGMIYVVTKKSLSKPLDIFFFLTNLLLTGGININPVLIYDDQRKDIAISPREYVDFLGAIFPTWWEHRQRYPDVQPFKSLVENIIEGKRSLGCADSGDCIYHHINIAPNGETSQCGRAGDWGLLQYGNIVDFAFSEILGHPERDQLSLRLDHIKQTECKACRFWEICHGGCPLDAYSKHNNFMHKSEWCESKKAFIKDYFEPITGATFEPFTK